MRFSGLVLSALLTVATTGCGHSSNLDWLPETAARLDGLSDIRRDHSSGRVIVFAGDQRSELTLQGGTFVLTETANREAPVSDVDPIPDGRIARGSGTIAEAWFAGPTLRYRHGVLGDAVEAESLKLRLKDGSVLEYKLPDDSVFEDLEPRIIALNGDAAVLVVRSYLSAGAAIAVFRVADGRIQLVAEADPIGIPNRWLNPVGAADFDGDGITEIAAVVTPHLSGRLTLYRQAGDGFVREAVRSGYSTHFIGSTVLAMSTATDVDGDGIVDIVLPSLDRENLAVVSFAGGKARELGAQPQTAAIVTSIIAADLDGKGAPDLVYGLENGDLMVIRR